MYPSRSWAEILPQASEPARDLVGGLVVYQSSDRMAAEEVSSLLFDFAQRTH